ncbi:MAG: hypothetical protein J5819_05775, partial [Eubacterium sp.]|nr:hypothetical protein [Eubacterium sp.]
NNMGIDVEKYQNVSSDNMSELIGEIDLEDIMNIYTAMNSIHVNLDKNSNLSNGDTITITYSFDEEKAKEVNAEFVGEPMTQTVSGLDEIQMVDPFEHINVTFEGTAPNAYISWTSEGNEEWMSGIYFEVDRQDNLNVGDEVTMSVVGYDENEFSERYGVKLSTTSKTYTVENVDAYITDNSTELEPDALDMMRTATEGYISEYFGDSSRNDAIKLDNLKFEGYYLLTNVDITTWYGHNKVYIIYSGKVSSKEKPKQFKPTTVYFPVEYDDLKKLADGSYDIDVTYKRILGSTDLRFGYWQTVSGYTDEATMEDELINAEGDTYEAEIYME